MHFSISSKKKKGVDIKKMVDLIWHSYDKDHNGNLNIDEARQFIMSYMQRIGCVEDFDEDIFLEIFDQIDKDESDTIERKEMVDFITRMMQRY